MQSALYQAIKVQKEQEAKMGYTGPSAMLATWEQMLKELREGKAIYIQAGE
jgi:hypothetical protein